MHAPIDALEEALERMKYTDTEITEADLNRASDEGLVVMTTSGDVSVHDQKQPSLADALM